MVKIMDLVNAELCTGCGLCVSEAGGSLEMRWNENGFLTPHKVGAAESSTALRVCPFNPMPEAEVCDEDALANIFLKEARAYDDQIGRFENTYIGYSKAFRETSSSGGIATYVFEQLLKNKHVDQLYVVVEQDGAYAYQLFNNLDAIQKISKTRYIPVTLEQLFLDLDQLTGTVAIAAVACFIKAIRLKQHYNPALKAKIPFLIGIICGGWKSRFFTDFLAQSAQIYGPYKHAEYRLKDAHSLSSDYSFGAYDEQAQFHQLKMSAVGDMWGTGLFKAKACEFCTDVLSELADISLGDAWLDEYRKDGLGNSIIVTRTKLAERLIQAGIADKSLVLKAAAKDLIIKSQSASFTHRHGALKFRYEVLHKHSLKPYIRERILKNSSLVYKLVQFQREQTRQKSLVLWRKYKAINTFNRQIWPSLFVLKVFTKAYHKLK